MRVNDAEKEVTLSPAESVTLILEGVDWDVTVGGDGSVTLREKDGSPMRVDAELTSFVFEARDDFGL